MRRLAGSILRPPQQIRQLGDVGRYPSRLVLGQPAHNVASAFLIFVIDVGEFLAFRVANAETFDESQQMTMSCTLAVSR
jgi:hypothetical protein